MTLRSIKLVILCGCCEVRQTYGCPEYKATDDQSVLSQNNETVVLGCVRSSNAARTWTVHCVDGQWTTTDDQSVDCRAIADRGQSKLGSSTDLGNQSTVPLVGVMHRMRSYM